MAGIAAVWGPTAIEGTNLYIYKGEKCVLPPFIRDIPRFLEQLKHLESFERAYSLPEHRKYLFDKKLSCIAQHLPTNKVLVAYAVASVFIICCAATSAVLRIKANF